MSMLEPVLADNESSTSVKWPIQRLITRVQLEKVAQLFQHAYIMPSIVLVLMVFSWILSHNTGDIFKKERLAQYYFVQAESILKGRLDISPDAIVWENHQHDGKYYGYFGIVPALLRIPVVELFPGTAGCWSGIFMLFASALSLLYTYRILMAVHRLAEDRYALTIGRKIIFSLFLLLCGLGSTLIFLSSRATVYHEAILWASTFNLMFIYYFIRFYENPSYATLSYLFSFAFLAFFSRASSGVSTFIILLSTCLFLAVSCISKRLNALVQLNNLWQFAPSTPSAKATRLSLSILIFLAAASMIHIALNYEKFGKLCLQPPVETYHPFRVRPQRLKEMGEQNYIDTSKLKTTSAAYFGVQANLFSKRFPFVQLSKERYIFEDEHLDWTEYFVSIPEGLTALFLLSALGLIGCLKYQGKMKVFRVLMAGAFSGGAVILLVSSVNLRYIHDFYPFFVLGSILGVYEIGKQSLVMRSLSILIFLTIGMINIYTNIFLALEYRYWWGSMSVDSQISYHNFCKSFGDRGIGESIPPLRAIEIRERIRKSMVGMTWKMKTDKGESLFCFTRSWTPLWSQCPSIDFHGQVLFAADSFPKIHDPNFVRYDPIASIGPEGGSCSLIVAYYPSNRIAFGFGEEIESDSRDVFTFGEIIEVPIEQFMDIEVKYDDQKRLLSAHLSKKLVFETRCTMPESEYYQVHIGGNYFNWRIAWAFSGFLVPPICERANADDLGRNFIDQYPYLYYRDLLLKELELGDKDRTDQ